MNDNRPQLSPNTLRLAALHPEGMDLEEEPTLFEKNRSRRASTLAYSSPVPKSHPPKVKPHTIKSLAKYYTDVKMETGQPEDQIYFDQVFDKMRGFRLGGFLQRHGIKEKFRGKMLDWMAEVLAIYQQKPTTLFKSYFLLDLFYDQARTEQTLEQLHLNGMVCMLIASKSEEVGFIKLSAVVETIGRGKFSKEQIIKKELEILTTIGFRTNFPTIHDLLKVSFRLVGGFSSERIAEFFRKSSTLLAKMCCFSYDMVVNLSIQEIVLFSMVIALKMCKKVGHGECEKQIKKLFGLFEVKDSALVKRKLDLVRNFVAEFNNIVPYAKNLESFQDVYESCRKAE